MLKIIDNKPKTLAKFIKRRRKTEHIIPDKENCSHPDLKPQMEDSQLIRSHTFQKQHNEQLEDDQSPKTSVDISSYSRSIYSFAFKVPCRDDSRLGISQNDNSNKCYDKKWLDWVILKESRKEAIAD